MKKHRSYFLNKTMVKIVIPVLIILGLICALSYKQKAEALSNRGKKVLGIAAGAALMGATAGAAGGAKWVPLGLFGGGLAGGLIARGAVKDNYESLERKKEKLERKLKASSNQKRRDALKKQLDGVNEKLQRRQYK